MSRLNVILGMDRTDIPGFNEPYEPLKIEETDRLIFRMQNLSTQVMVEKN